MNLACIGLLPFFLGLALGQAAPRRSTSVGPQLQFSAEDEAVKHPVYLPDVVFMALVNDPRVQDFSRDDHTDRSWFSAEKLRIPSAIEQLYLVMGEGPLRGANTVPFWLVRENTRTHKADILWEASELGLALSYKPHAVYPDINVALVGQQLVWEETFRYIGGKYIRSHSNEAENRRKLEQPSRP